MNAKGVPEIGEVSCSKLGYKPSPRALTYTPKGVPVTCAWVSVVENDLILNVKFGPTHKDPERFGLDSISNYDINRSKFYIMYEGTYINGNVNVPSNQVQLCLLVVVN